MQITATPKANRQKDLFSDSQNLRLPQIAQEEKSTVIPPSSLPRIPQSISRPSHERPSGGDPLLASIQATPTRKAVPALSQVEHSLTGANGLSHGAFPPSSPLHARRSSAQLFNVVPESAGKSSSSTASYGIQETPVKKRSETLLDHSHPSMPGPSCYNKENVGIERGAVVNTGLSKINGTRKEESIYHSLGWDDADDIDDLA